MKRAILAVVLGAAPVSALAAEFSLIGPRNGEIRFFAVDPGSELRIAATDVDEDVSSAPLTDYLRPGFLYYVFDDFVFDDVTDGGLISQAPHNLDAGDYAYAVGILDDSGPVDEITAYFQIRLAGSSATIQDTSLATSAIAAGLWTDVDDYIEFGPQFALVFPVETPTGPDSFGQSVFPEPTSFTLTLLLGAVGLCKRRSGKRSE